MTSFGLQRQATKKDPKMIGLWKVGRTIGKGASGRVKIARHTKTGQLAAIKIVSKQALLNSRISVSQVDEETERNVQALEREIVVMKLIDHPNLMRLYDVWETSSELFLILEYAEGGELFEYLCEHGRLETDEALHYFQQIIAAVDYCHRFNIAHRDLKPENVLLDKNNNVKVADFGMAASWMGQDDMMRTACGSPHYAAPEVISGEAYNAIPADIWSCGVILYALVAGKLPFDDDDLHTLLQKIQVGKYEIPDIIDPRAQDLIRRMLEMDVSKRITMPEILVHPFYTVKPPRQLDHQVPDFDEIARPLTSVSDIDQDILANLRTLWPDVGQEDVISNLLDEDPTWEKGVYHLLVHYRAKHLEEFDEDEEKRMAEKRAERRRKRKAEKERREAETKAKEAERRERSAERLELPPRTGPPTPRRATRGQGLSFPDSRTPSPMQALSGIQRLSILGSSTLAPPISDVAQAGSANASPDIGGQEADINQFLMQIADHLSIMQSTPRSTTIQGPSASPNVTPTPLGQARNANITRPLSVSRRNTEKENTRAATSNSQYLTPQHAYQIRHEDDTPRHKSSLRSQGSTRKGRRVQIAEPTLAERAGLRPHQYGSSSCGGSPVSSSALSVSDGSGRSTSQGGSMSFSSATPKRRWFGNIFRFKPASYQLQSTEEAFRTRLECQEILERMGVNVVLTQAESLGVLKCRLDECRDPTGILYTLKATRFRVEVMRPTTVDAIGGYKTVLRMVMEKGAASSFKLVYSRLNKEWDFDVVPQRVQGRGSSYIRDVISRDSSPVLVDDERFVEVVYDD
ncbi:Pkinase-domain-containing protein [Panus rudis PR-1116 ss-1]|nr:Pkinase-domain-containing protein [Panus rudis PR-1116 ss-1]